MLPETVTERANERQQHDDAQDQLRAALAAAFAQRDRDTWVAVLAGEDTCVAPVQSVSEVAHDPQFQFSDAR